RFRAGQRALRPNTGRPPGRAGRVAAAPPRTAPRQREWVLQRQRSRRPTSRRRTLTDLLTANLPKSANAGPACEGIHLTAEEEALFEQMGRERLTADERAAR